MIDRIAPTIRPDQKADGTQRWQSLLFCHWEVSAESLQELVPDALEIDTFEGRAFVGVVPFQMRQIKPSWLPPSLAFNFLETNVRTYVVHKDRPGVYFFSLDASSRLAVFAARLGWSLPYFHARMIGKLDSEEQLYTSRRTGIGRSLNANANHHVRFSTGADMGESQPGTLEHFLFERYLLFVERRAKIYVGQVYHKPYQVQEARVHEMSDNLLAAAGLPSIDRVPDLAHYSPGVDVEVFGIRPALQTAINTNS